MSESAAGRAVDSYLNQRSSFFLRRNRLCQGVLLLPSEHAVYLRGRRRQALRTNLRRAAAAGIVCEQLTDPALAYDAASIILQNRRAGLSDVERHVLRTSWSALFARREMSLIVARNRGGRPVAVMAAVIDESVCLIDVAVASSHEARWALHDHLVQMLITRGVRYVLVAGGGLLGALNLTEHERYYQHLLGYELRHVIPMTPYPVTSRRRLAASVVVALLTAAALIAPPAAAGAGAARLGGALPVPAPLVPIIAPQRNHTRAFALRPVRTHDTPRERTADECGGG